MALQVDNCIQKCVESNIADRKCIISSQFVAAGEDCHNSSKMLDVLRMTGSVFGL